MPTFLANTECVKLGCREKEGAEKMKTYKMLLLTDTKEERIELSKKVQEHAFKLGYGWRVHEKKIYFEGEPFLFFCDDGDICYMGFDYFRYFLNADFELITPEEFLRLKDAKGA
jgi:hypothetical protein